MFVDFRVQDEEQPGEWRAEYVKSLSYLVSCPTLHALCVEKQTCFPLWMKQRILQLEMIFHPCGKSVVGKE